MTVRFLLRKDCGLAPRNLARLTRRPLDLGILGITLHCTGSPTADPLHKWRQIQQLAMEGRLPSGDRYGDTPYNGGITLDGRVLEGRGGDVIGGHAKSTHNVANRHTDGLAVLGDGNTLTPAAEQAIRAVGFLFHLRYGHPPIWFDHLDWRTQGGIVTACPGPAVVALTNQLRTEQRQGR